MADQTVRFEVPTGDVLQLIDRLENSTGIEFISRDIRAMTFGPNEAAFKRHAAAKFAKMWFGVMSSAMVSAAGLFKHLHVPLYGQRDATTQLSAREDVQKVLGSISRAGADDVDGLWNHFSQFHGTKHPLSAADRAVLLQSIDLRISEIMVEQHDRLVRARNNCMPRIETCLTRGE